MKLIVVMFSAAFWIGAGSAAAQSWQPLYEHVDPVLQARLEAALKRDPTRARLINRQKFAVGVVDLGSNPPRFARVNGNVMMYAASLPKIAIMLGVYASFEDGSLRETPQIHEDLGNMIRVSSNSAATRLLDTVGMTKLRTILSDPRYGFYDEARGGGLWVGKRYAKDGPRIGDPLHGISHGATATQVCRFYYLLESGRLINPERSAQMLEDLSEPGLHHKFVAGMDERAPSAALFRKSGTWRDWHSDSMLVRGPVWRNYILVGLVESPNGEAILRQLVSVVEPLLFVPTDPLTTQAQR